MKNATVFIASAFGAAYIATEKALQVVSFVAYYQMLAIAYLFKACVIVYAVVQYFGDCYYQDGGSEWVAQELEPTVQAAMVVYAFVAPVVVTAVVAVARKVEEFGQGLLAERLPAVMVSAIASA